MNATATNPASMRIEYLVDHPDVVPLVSDWIFDEWAHRRPQLTRTAHLAEVSAALSRESVPIQLIALDQGIACGVAILKPHEMFNLFPDWHCWLGSVFVRTESRGRGVATLLCQRIETIARALGIPRLHLQTERLDGGLYAKLGFQPVKDVHHNGYHVLVMKKDL